MEENNNISTENLASKEPEKNINYNTNYNTNYYKNDKKHGCLFYGIIAIIIIFVGFMAVIIASAALFSSLVSDSSYSSYPDSSYVETLYIEGTISESTSYSYGETGYNHTWTINEVERLIDDENNKGILLYINSPGGGTYESDEMYLELKKYKEKTGRPIYAYYAQTAASGALYISMAADEIYANRMTMTGSIGVIMQNYDASGLMEKLGIKSDNIVSGRNKGMGGYDGLTDEQKQILQSMVNESYDIFVGIVSDERGIPLEKAKEIADGRVYSAHQAKNLGLIDEISTYDGFMDTMQNKEEFKDCDFTDAYYENTSILNMLMSKIGIPQRKSLEQNLLEAVEYANENPMQYKFGGIGQ